MTTVEPGASEVFTHGLRVRPLASAFRASSPAATITYGFEVLVQEVIAAITTRPWSRSKVSSSRVTAIASPVRPLDRRHRRAGDRRARLAALVVVVLGRRVGGREGLVERLVVARAELLGGVVVELRQRLEEGRLGVVSETRSCGRFGPAIDGTTSPRSSSSVSVKIGSSESLVVEHALLARVGVDQLDRLGRPAGQLEVTQRLGVDREDRAGRAELGRHVAERRAVDQRQRRQARAVELDELGDDAALAQHLGDGEDEVGRGRAVGQLAGELEADTCGSSIEIGWPSIAASASIPPTPQPSTPRPLTIVVCESVPTSVSG